MDENSRHTVEENGIDIKVANPYKTRIIAEAKIKSDKLDARILSDLLLRTDLYMNHMYQIKKIETKGVVLSDT